MIFKNLIFQKYKIQILKIGFFLNVDKNLPFQAKYNKNIDPAMHNFENSKLWPSLKFYLNPVVASSRLAMVIVYVLASKVILAKLDIILPLSQK